MSTPPPSYYEATRNYHPPITPLTGAQRADVAVIGGGITGVSVALHLAERGVDVAVVEGQAVGWGASGRSGGQIITGYSADQMTLERLTGRECARELWAHSKAAVDWVRERCARHAIDCDLTWNYLHAALKPAQARYLQTWAAHMAAHYDYDLRYLDRAQLREVLGSAVYCGALADDGSGHLHPLNYCLGLARAAEAAGARFYAESPVVRVAQNADGVTVHCVHDRHGSEHGSGHGGTLACDQVVYACNAYLDDLNPQLAANIMPVATCIIATEPLSAADADALIANRAAVADCGLVLDYYRLSADNRMLFGGRVGYSGLEPTKLVGALRRRMTRVFPQLKTARVDFSWGGYVAITRNRAPHIGRLNSRTHFAQGFSGQGMALSGYVGGLLADAVLGDDEKLKPFQQIPHKHFSGGVKLRMPLLVTVMAARRFRDWMPF